MYVPAQFAEVRSEVLATLIGRHPLATLITSVAGEIGANHLPLQLRPLMGESGILVGHVARPNPVWRQVPSGSEVLAVFQGGDHYISPRWYASKREHGKVVPTWNYAVVHVRGTIRWREDVEWLRSHLSELTAAHEAGTPDPWRLEDAPEEYLQRMMSGIVGLEISIREVTGKWKVSQNRQQQDRLGAMAGLAEVGTDSALAMRDRIAAARCEGEK
jgi:transcriptional regulator